MPFKYIVAKNKFSTMEEIFIFPETIEHVHMKEMIEKFMNLLVLALLP